MNPGYRMELRDIEYFSVVAEHRHLGRAAEALGLTQPALSKCLRRLETALEAKLVRRTSTGVELTAEGTALASRVRDLRLSLDDVAREVRDLTHGRVGVLRVGAAPGMVDRLLPASCAGLLKDAPQATFKVAIGHNNILLPALRNGDLDLIVSGIPGTSYQDLVQEYLCDDEFVVFGSAHHPLAHRGEVSLAELLPFRWASGSADVMAWQRLCRAFDSSGLPAPRSALEAGSHSLRGLVTAASDLLCFGARADLTETARRLRLAEIPVRNLQWTRRVGVSYRKSAYLSPIARRFIELLKTATVAKSTAA